MDRNSKLDIVDEAAIIVGVDIAKKTHCARIVNKRGKTLVKPFYFNNTREGFEMLEAKMKDASNGGRILVGMEPTGHYWKPLAAYLKTRGIMVVNVNPYHVKQTKETYDNSQTKSDPKDTGIISELVIQGKYMSLVSLTGAYADLRALTIARKQVNASINSTLNNIHCIIDEYFPEFRMLFADIVGMTSLWVLSEAPFPTDVLAMDLESLVMGIKSASNRRQGRKKAIALKEAAQLSIGCIEGLAGARIRLDIHLKALKEELERLQQIETEMETKLGDTRFKDILLSAPGVGFITAATLLGEMGSPDDYEDWRQVRKLAGLNLVHQSFGKKKGKTTVSKRGRPGLRHVLYMIALAMSSKNAEMKAFINYLKSRRNNPLSRTSAMTALSCKVLRVLFGMMKSRQTYDPTKVLGAYRSSQIALAA